MSWSFTSSADHPERKGLQSSARDPWFQTGHLIIFRGTQEVRLGRSRRGRGALRSGPRQTDAFQIRGVFMIHHGP